MATKKKSLLIRVQPEHYEKVKALAEANTRTMANMVEHMIAKYIKEYENKNGSINSNVEVNNGNINNEVVTINNR